MGKYEGITTKVLKDGNEAIYVRFKHQGRVYPVKNFTKLFKCKTEKSAYDKLQIVKHELSAGRDPFNSKIDSEILNDMFDEMVRTNIKSGKWRQGTVSTFTTFYNKWIRNKIGKTKISKITYKEILEIYEEDMSSIKPYTRLTLRKVLKALYERAIGDEIIIENLALRIKPLPGTKKKKEKLDTRTPDKFIDIVRKVYNTIPHYKAKNIEQQEEIRNFLMLILLTSHRHGELRKLRKRNIYIEHGFIQSPSEITKTNTEYKFPLPQELIPYISKIKNKDDLIFPTIKKGSIVAIYQRLLEMTDITVIDGKKITLHDFRRFQTMIMIKELKFDSTHADYCLSHETVNSLGHYLSFDYDDAKEAYEKYWEFIRQPINFTPKERIRKRKRTKAEMEEARRKEFLESKKKS